MPLIDKEGILKEIVLLNDFDVAPKEEWVVIMAGGLGSRLGELTKDIPKPMLPMGEDPCWNILLIILKNSGFINLYYASIIKLK